MATGNPELDRLVQGNTRPQTTPIASAMQRYGGGFNTTQEKQDQQQRSIEEMLKNGQLARPPIYGPDALSNRSTGNRMLRDRAIGPPLNDYPISPDPDIDNLVDARAQRNTRDLFEQTFRNEPNLYNRGPTPGKAPKGRTGNDMMRDRMNGSRDRKDFPSDDENKDDIPGY